MKDKIRIIVWGSLALAIILLFIFFSPRRSLYDAVADGNVDRIECFLAKGADINAPSPWKDHNPKLTIFGLLEFGREEYGRYGKGDTPLLIAVVQQENLVPWLIEKGAEVDTGTSEGYTPLMAAAGWRHPSAIDDLLKAGANPNKANENGQTALHYAASIGNRPGIIVTLIAHGADINAQAHDGSTPLHSAVTRFNKLNIDVLMKYGADPNVRDKSGMTPKDLLEKNEAGLYKDEDRKLLEKNHT